MATKTEAQKQAELMAAGWSPSAGDSVDAAYARTATQADGGNAPNPTSTTTTPAPTAATAAGGAGVQQLMNALASGNAAAAAEITRQFNATFGLDQQKFAASVQQYNQTFGLQQAAVTGKNPDGSPTLAANQDAFTNAINAAGLTGVFNDPRGGASGGQAGSQALQQYAAGTVVRTPNNQFGIIGPNGTVTPGDVSNPTIYAAIQRNAGIPTVAAGDFAQGSAPGGGGGGGGGVAGGGVQTLASQLQQANLSGQYNGAPTEVARQFAATQAEGARQFNVSAAQAAQDEQDKLLNNNNTTGLGMLNLASSLHADPFRQVQVMYGANQMDGVNRAVQGLTGQYGLPGSFTAPGVDGNTANLGGLTNSYNNAPQQYAANNQFLQNNFQNPNQIITREYNNAPQNVKDLTTSGLSANTGLDQSSIDKQLQNNLPKFNAPSFGLASV